MHRVVANGVWGRVEWAVDSRGGIPARNAFDELDQSKKAKLLRLFKQLAEHGYIHNTEHFKDLPNGQGGKLWEFKSFQERFLGDFRPGRRFVIALRTKPKKRRRADPEEIKRALRLLGENDEYERRSPRGK